MLIKNYILRLACAWYAFRFGQKWKVKWWGNVLDYDVISWKDYYAVALFETGNLESSLYKRANNAFGMRVPSVRRWFGNGEDNNYSTYSSTWWSVRDYFEWLDYSGFANWWEVYQGPDGEGLGGVLPLVGFMKQKNYFEADLFTYSDGVSFWISQNINKSNPITNLVVAIFGPTSLFLLWKFYKTTKKSKY